MTSQDIFRLTQKVEAIALAQLATMKHIKRFYRRIREKQKLPSKNQLLNSVQTLATYAGRCGFAFWNLEPLLKDGSLPPRAIVIAVAGTKEEIDIAIEAVCKIQQLQKQRKASEN